MTKAITCGTIARMANDEQRSEPPSEPPSESWLSKRAGLLILVVLGAIVLWRLMATWLHWLLFAVLAGAVVTFAKRWLGGRESDET